jgi:23S rRNA (guanosine2251-2'-O)-methyltransferase
MKKLKTEELQRKTVEEFKFSAKSQMVVVLDNVRSLSNVGAVFRISDAFLIEKIYLCGITGTPPHRDIHKTALGATETVAWEYVESTILAIQELKAKGYVIVLIEQMDTSIFLQDFDINSSQEYALVFGNEVNGISEEIMPLADFALEIPQLGSKHSLNVSVASGIVIWHFVSQTLFKAV